MSLKFFFRCSLKYTSVWKKKNVHAEKEEYKHFCPSVSNFVSSCFILKWNKSRDTFYFMFTIYWTISIIQFLVKERCWSRAGYVTCVSLTINKTGNCPVFVNLVTSQTFWLFFLS
jgi:hypothetical protein